MEDVIIAAIPLDSLTAATTSVCGQAIEFATKHPTATVVIGVGVTGLAAWKVYDIASNNAGRLDRMRKQAQTKAAEWIRPAVDAAADKAKETVNQAADQAKEAAREAAKPKYNGAEPSSQAA